MYKLARISLNNEQSLILAHKRTMKLGELAGLPLVARTTFVTAVSEIVQDAIHHGVDASLTLGVSPESESGRCIIATITDCGHQITRQKNKHIDSASLLVDDFKISKSEIGSKIELGVRLPASQCFNDAKMEQWKGQFSTEPAELPTDEIRRKNSQLQELAERLRTSERNYQVLTDSLPLMIFTASFDGKVLYANDLLKKYTGQSVASINETHWTAVIHEDDAASWWSNWTETASAGNTFRAEIRIKNAESGAYVWHLVTAKALRDEKNDLYWSGFLVNIQAQKMVERTLKDNQELTETKQKLEKYQHELKLNIGELNRSNQELAEFAYVASHDLQEPLRKIQSFGTVLVDQFKNELSAPAQDLVQRMHQAAERMHSLIKDILTYSRLNTHHQPFRLIDLNALMQEVLGDLDVTIREKNARIDVEPLPGGLYGNLPQLRQLFQNLLSNALKFSAPDRALRIQIFTREVTIFDIPTPVRNREPSYLAISVADNGIGFDERYHNRIFQLFQRLHGKDQYAGTGIGLTICKKVAEMHGGTIAAQSHPGQGATFTVYLPQQVAV